MYDPALRTNAREKQGMNLNLDEFSFLAMQII